MTFTSFSRSHEDLSPRDDEIFVSWTIFEFFRQILIDCINISKFINNDMSRCELTGGGFMGVGMGWWGDILVFSGKHF